jgi:hypothetical protein
MAQNRDCAVSKLRGRTYNATGEGDHEIDAGTIYANYEHMLKLAPNIQYAFERVDALFLEVRKELRRKIDEEKESLAEGLAHETF